MSKNICFEKSLNVTGSIWVVAKRWRRDIGHILTNDSTTYPQTTFHLICTIIRICKVLPLWCSSGQRARLLFQQSEFESRFRLHFFCKMLFEKNENIQKEAGVGPSNFICIKTISISNSLKEEWEWFYNQKDFKIDRNCNTSTRPFYNYWF